MKRRLIIISVSCLLIAIFSVMLCVEERISFHNVVSAKQNNNEYIRCRIQSFNLVNNLDTSKKRLVDKANLVSDYILDNLQTKKLIKSFSFSELLKMVDGDIRTDGLCDFTGKTTDEKKVYILELYGIVMDRYLQKLQTPFLSFTNISVVPISNQDTLEIGEAFKANIYMDIKDLTGECLIEFEDGTSFHKKDAYCEIANKKGLNIKKGNLVYNNGFMQYLFPIEIKYYVR